MNNAVSLLPPEDSDASDLLTVIALTGEFPVTQASRMVSSKHYLEKTITRLKKNRLIRTYYKDGLRGYRLTAKAKKQLIKEHPSRFKSIFTGDTIINMPKYSVPDRLRLHRMAEVYVTMTQSDVVTYPWRKPTLFHDGHISDEVLFASSIYYTAAEIKEIGQEAAKIRGSRATGVLLTQFTDYVVYNTGNTEMMWKYQSEIRLKTLLGRELKQARLSKGIESRDLAAIVFASDMKQMLALMDTLKQSKHQYFILDGAYPHFFCVTSDKNGEFLLQLLCDADLRIALDDLLSEDLTQRNPQAFVENDGFDTNGDPVLFAYTCDMPRIKRFDNALALQEKAGTLVCFDYQADVMRRVCGPTVKIQALNTEVLRGGIVDQ